MQLICNVNITEWHGVCSNVCAYRCVYTCGVQCGMGLDEPGASRCDSLIF